MTFFLVMIGCEHRSDVERGGSSSPSPPNRWRWRSPGNSCMSPVCPWRIHAAGTWKNVRQHLSLDWLGLTQKTDSLSLVYMFSVSNGAQMKLNVYYSRDTYWTPSKGLHHMRLTVATWNQFSWQRERLVHTRANVAKEVELEIVQVRRILQWSLELGVPATRSKRSRHSRTVGHGRLSPAPTLLTGP